jgi:nicotinamidase-related amidase
MTIPAPLPLPSFFRPESVSTVWRVPYQERAQQAKAWAKEFHLPPSASDRLRICLVIIDAQNTFCIPEFELFVSGRSGTGAIDDNRRLCEFIYRNLARITEIVATMDTHTAMQIFHPVFWINAQGEHPTANGTIITLEDVQSGRWQVNPAIAYSVAQGDYESLQRHALHYVKKLSADGKYPLTVWAYHSMLGGIGHALVSAVEEALFFHNIARHSQTSFEIKGNHPLTENYSVLRPEVLESADGQAIAPKNTRLLNRLLEFDAVIIAGQAKSHCVAWTVDDLLSEIKSIDPKLAQKVYLLEDCTSPVVVPEVVDFTAQADQAFQRFAEAGMHLVQSTTPMEQWQGLNL